MSLIQIIVMVIAGIGMLIGLSKQKAGVAWGKPLAIGCIVVALIAALWNIIRTAQGPNTDGIVKKEMRYQEIGGEKLGSYLAEKYSGKKALLLKTPSVSSDGTGTPDSLVKGLKEGLGSDVTIVAEVAPEIPKDASKAFAAEMPMEGAPGEEGMGMEGEMLPPLEYWYTAKIFDKIVGEHKDDIDIVITTIGLPQDARNSKILRNKKDRPLIAILNGSIYDLRGAFQPDMVVAAITYNPNAEYGDDSIPKDLDEAFNKRFLLVTPDNLSQVTSGSPDIFRSGGRR